MTDPVYGDNPIDPEQLWYACFAPALVLDPEWVVWRKVFCNMMLDFLRSQWAIRWRMSVMTAAGAQLQERGAELQYLQPDGWDEERYRNVLIALLAASWLHPTPKVVGDLANALLDEGQSFVMVEEQPCSARFTYQETDADEAVSYLAALNRARPAGCQFFLVAHPGGGADPFVIGTSTINGPDTLAELFS